MPFASYRRLPFISSYEQALKHLQKAVPIRGRKPVLYPLADNRYDRRYADKFAIRMVGDADSLPVSHYYKQIPCSKDGDIELLLYSQPVVVFHKPDTTNHGEQPQQLMTLSGGGYAHARWSACDVSFFFEVLGKYLSRGNRKKEMLVLQTRQSTKYVLQQGEIATFAINPLTQTMTKATSSHEPMTTFKLNRKATNIVRAKYGDFYRYVKGMNALRSELKQSFMSQANGDPCEPYKIIVVGAEEIRLAVGEAAIADPFMPNLNAAMRALLAQNTVNNVPKSGNVLYVQPENFPYMMYKPPKVILREVWNADTGRNEQVKRTEKYDTWLARIENFLSLISAPAEDPDRVEKFARAYTLLLLQQRTINFSTGGSVGFMERNEYKANQAPKDLDELIFKYHSKEVFDVAPVPDGVVPNTRYNKWVDREVDSM